MKITYSFPAYSGTPLSSYIQELNQLDDGVNFSVNLINDISSNSLTVNIVRQDNEEIWSNVYNFLITVLQ